MRRGRLLVALKAVAGLIAGIAVWAGLSQPYNRVLASATQPILRAFERPAVTRLQARDDLVVIDRADFQRQSGRPGLRPAELTVNFVLLAALFAANRKPLWTRNVARFSLAALCLTIPHILALIVNIEWIYAAHLGPWSERNYSSLERNVWGAGMQFYAIIGGFGSAFLLWWVFRPQESERTPAGRSRRGRA